MTQLIDGIEYKVIKLPSQVKNNPKSLYGVKNRGSKRRNTKYDQCHLMAG